MTGFVVAVLVRFGSLSRLGLGAVVAALVAGSASVASGSTVGLGSSEYCYGYDAAPYDYGDPANVTSPVVGADILGDALGLGSDVFSPRSAGLAPSGISSSPLSRVAPRAAADDFVNLASDSRSAHILDGHRAGAGLGKSEFPAGWSDELTLNHVSDIATDPTLTWVQQTGKAGAEFTKNGVPVKYVVDGVRDGVTIRVIIQPGGEGIITAFPIG